MSILRVAVSALGAAVLAACGSAMPPPPPGTALDLHQAGEAGPRIPNGAILAASDLATIRALVDASDAGMAGQVGGAVVRHACLPPYTTEGGGSCWAGLTSQPDQAYLALDAEGGFCTTPGTPRLAVSGMHLELQLPYVQDSGCHIQGSMAVPTATLFWFPTARLAPGLYSVSYVFQSTSDAYRSSSTYLSVPGPPAGQPADLDRDATAALTSVVGMRRGIFSVSRVDGAQLGGLCGTAVPGTAYLVTYESQSPRQMTVALAGPAPRTCATTRI